MTQAPAPLGFRTIHQQVVHTLGRSIAIGDYPVGAQLPQEPVLCQQLRVSRGALREAVKALGAKGMLETRPRTGTRVLPQQSWNLLDADVLAWLGEADRDALVVNLNELRALIEPGAARLAAVRASKREALELAAACEAMDIAARAGDAAALTEADVEFHRVLLAISQNPLLGALANPLHLALHATFEVTISAAGAVDETIPLHTRVAEAIAAGDARAAASAMTRLVEVSQEHFRRVRLAEQDAS